MKFQEQAQQESFGRVTARALLGFIVLSLSLSAFAATPETNPYQARVEKLMRKYKVSAKDLGVYVQEPRAGQSPHALFALNENQSFVPASLTKLITAAAAFESYEPGTKLMTELYIQGAVKGNRLEGNLYLKGGGDPTFVSEHMWALVNEFTRTGIAEISGDLILDASRFDQQKFDDGRQDQRVDRAYDAPVGALSFNWNSVNVFVRPGEKAGAPARVTLDPINNFSILNNSVKTVSKGKASIAVSRTHDKKLGKDVVHVSGQIPVGHKEIVQYKNITDPSQWTGENLRSFLRQRGIEIKGRTRDGTVPGNAVLAADIESVPISEMISDMQKYSNNFVAEMLTKNLAAKKKQPANMQDGLVVIHEFLKKIGWKSGEYTFVNASGLTRGNTFSPRQLAQVLEHARTRFDYYPEFLAALPRAGIDGTMKSRLRSTAAEGWVRAKTGLLNGVVALAGYIGRPENSPASFVFIYNGSRNEYEMRQFLDELVLVFMEE